ncbi:MAG: 3-deoxy-D-manno-octulosonic acid transferase [Bacteroidia bacterium]|nr:3-deoxy-D-manno-octulosonic acid transferase [Bacteroidia bacterium]
MQFLYCILIRLYYLTILIVSPFNTKAHAWIKGRKNLFKILKNSLEGQSNVVWFHCASLGEFEQGRPVIEAYRIQNPDHKILLTFFSPSGYEIRKNYNGADWVFYLPLDTRSNVRRFLNIVKPLKVIFVKYEFWQIFLKELHKNNIPVYLISAIFRKEQLFFKWYGGWYKKLLDYFTHIFVQNEESFNLLNSINIMHTSVAGDTRFDRVYEIASNAKLIKEASVFSEGHKIIIIGSAWPKDEEVLVPYINKSSSEIKFIIAPHEISESGLIKTEERILISVVRFSKASESDLKTARVLLVDNVGMLSSLYKYGNIAYIGGGFGKGIHNILEAAVFGLPVLFGSNYHKFSEAVDLIKEKGAFSINSNSELEQHFNKLLNDNSYCKKTSDISKRFVENRIGATKKIIEFIN